MEFEAAIIDCRTQKCLAVIKCQDKHVTTLESAQASMQAVAEDLYHEDVNVFVRVDYSAMIAPIFKVAQEFVQCSHYM